MGNDQWGLGLHFIFVTTFLVATTNTCLGAQNLNVSCFEHERLALLKFKDSGTYDGGMFSSWVGYDCCHWERVQCDGVTGNVDNLDFSWSEVNYIISSAVSNSLGELRHLKHLDLRGNDFGGIQIPKFMSWLGQLTNLGYLDLSWSSLEGVVSEGHFANLSKLEYFSATYNYKLTFNFSDEWLPPFQLKSLDLNSCKIGNTFPQWLRNQRKLHFLVLSNTSISGTLPTWLRKIPMICFIDLSHNNLIGSLTNLPSMETCNGYPEIHVRDNNFNDSIPRLLCKMTRLILLDLSKNKLTGKIPNCFKNTNQLQIIILSSNEMSGIIPSFIGNYSSLSILSLNDNNFSGELPREIYNLSMLEVLDLGNNAFYGEIPEWIGEKVERLKVFRLHKNNFKGGIPQSLCRNPQLQILDVAHNNLTGIIPPCLGKFPFMTNAPRVPSFFYSQQTVEQVMKGTTMEFMRTLEYVINIDLSSNRLVGEIPIELTKLDGLVSLNLSNNYLYGGIPHTIGNMKSLNSLDFSRNKLSGLIPPSIGDLSFLSYLNLSNNNFSGRIPTGYQLQTLIDPSIYAGNVDLCGAPLPKNCSNHVHPNKNKYEASDKVNKLWFYLDILCGFTTGFWGFIMVLVFKKEWRHSLFMFAEDIMDKIYVAIMIRVNKIKSRREAV